MASNSLNKSFPILDVKVNEQELIYFDNAATTQKHQSVIERRPFVQTVLAVPPLIWTAPAVRL